MSREFLINIASYLETKKWYLYGMLITGVIGFLMVVVYLEQNGPITIEVWRSSEGVASELMIVIAAISFWLITVLSIYLLVTQALYSESAKNNFQRKLFRIFWSLITFVLAVSLFVLFSVFIFPWFA